MAIGYRQKSSADLGSPGATQAVTLPTGTVSGDIVVAVLGSGRASAACGSWTAPAGWTAVGSLLDQANGASHISLQVWRAAGSIANLTFTKVGTVASLGWLLASFTGVDTTTPIDATGTANSSVTSVATLTTNAVTVATSQAWHCIAFGDWLGGTFSATGFTNQENAAVNESAALLYNTTAKSTGSTGTVVVTSSAATTAQALIGVPFALRPAAGGSGGPFPFLRRNQGMAGGFAALGGGYGRVPEKTYSFARAGGLFLPERRIPLPARRAA